MIYNLIFSWIFCTVVYSQTIFSSKIGVDSSIALNRGIYANFHEFHSNQPSIKTPFVTREFEKFNSLFSKTFIACKLVVDHKYKDRFSKGMPVWGFCDGKKVYVRQFEMIFLQGKKEAQGLNVNPRKATYYPITFLGRFCIFTAVIKVPAKVLSGQNNATMSSNQNQGILFIIDINNGHIEKLTEDVVGRILENDPSMLKAFKGEKRKDKKLEDYIKSYSLKHPEEIEN